MATGIALEHQAAGRGENPTVPGRRVFHVPDLLLGHRVPRQQVPAHRLQHLPLHGIVPQACSRP